MRAIGIDIGTTTISLAVVEREGRRVLDARTIANDSFINSEKEWESIQDPGKILELAKEELDKLLNTYPGISSIGLTGQMHGILYTDREGRAVSPLYTWQDRRSDIPEFQGKTLAEKLKEELGIFLPPGYGLATHIYNVRKKLVPQSAASLCTIGDYIGMALSGRKEPLIHISNGASLGFFCQEEGRFQQETLKKAGINAEILPCVTRELSTLGAYKGIPVTAALGDNQAGFYGTVGREEETLLLNVGTGGQVSLMSRKYFCVPEIETRPYRKGDYLLVGASLCGGRAYAALERFFRFYVKEAGGIEAEQYGVMGKLAEKGMERKAGLKVVTSLKGTRQDPLERGGIYNLGEDNFTAEDLIYGVLEGIARELYEMYEKIQKGTGITAKRIVASGNGIRRNPVLLKICQEIFKQKIELTEQTEEAACGAAFSSMDR